MLGLSRGRRLGVVEPMWTTTSDCLCLGRHHKDDVFSLVSLSLSASHTHMQTQSFYHSHSVSHSPSPSSLSLSPPLALRCVCRQTVAKWLPLSPLVSVVRLVPPPPPPSLLGWAARSKVRAQAEKGARVGSGFMHLAAEVRMPWIHIEFCQTSPAGWQGRG